MSRFQMRLIFFFLSPMVLLSFQNCSDDIQFSARENFNFSANQGDVVEALPVTTEDDLEPIIIGDGGDSGLPPSSDEPTIIGEDEGEPSDNPENPIDEEDDSDDEEMIAVEDPDIEDMDPPVNDDDSDDNDDEEEIAVNDPEPTPQDPPGDVCLTQACDLNPIAKSAGVVTILLALGDQLNNNLVVNGFSAQLIAETMVKYASPVNEPKILIVQDRNHRGESLFDTEYISKTLLARYNPTYMAEPQGGLSSLELQGYDLVWFNNPGHPMGSKKSRDVLMDFKGGVVLSGDDLSYGKGFSLTNLTGVIHVDNGTKVNCGGDTYHHDNNSGYQYSVNVDESKFPGVSSDILNFQYGNDIDLVLPGNDVEVLAYAQGGHSSCQAKRPVIFRYEKESMSL